MVASRHALEHARHLPLKNGRTLHMLHDVSDVFTSGLFVGVKRSPALEHALDLLLRAAETGDPHDVAAATHQIAVALRVHGMMT